MPIKENLLQIKSQLPAHVSLVAVTKTKTAEEIMEAYNAGHRDFGENKIQELTEKQAVLPKDIRWHMIGHVQRNKVKYMAGFVHLIHGVDSMKLLQEIDKRAKAHDRVLPCLLQVHIAEEENKFGLSAEAMMELVASEACGELHHIRIKGLMGMATFTEQQDRIRKEFRYLKAVFDRLRIKIPQIDTLSMGMSGDFPIALEEGSTMVRIGSSIFGERGE